MATAAGLRERKKARTREAIVGAAIDLFERRGYDATTVEEIAAAADVSPRTFFRYFDTKLDVLSPTPDDDHVDLYAALAARPADEGVLEAVLHVLRHKLELDLDEGDDLTIRQHRLAFRTPSLRAVAREHLHGEEVRLAGVFAQRLGLAPDALEARLMAAAVGATLCTVFEEWAEQDHATVEGLLALADEAFALLARGLA
jgi:AcrR family transcriptional regulator